MSEKDTKAYPYLGKRTYKNQDYVILFTEENYGVVVMSDVEGNDALKFGNIGDFDESLFTYLPKEQCVRLSN